MVPEIWSVTDIFFIILDHFLPSYHPNNLKNQNVEKKEKKKSLEITHAILFLRHGTGQT